MAGSFFCFSYTLRLALWTLIYRHTPTGPALLLRAFPFVGSFALRGNDFYFFWSGCSCLATIYRERGLVGSGRIRNCPLFFCFCQVSNLMSTVRSQVGTFTNSRASHSIFQFQKPHLLRPQQMEISAGGKRRGGHPSLVLPCSDPAEFRNIPAGMGGGGENSRVP